MASFIETTRSDFAERHFLRDFRGSDVILNPSYHTVDNSLLAGLVHGGVAITEGEYHVLVQDYNKAPSLRPSRPSWKEVCDTMWNFLAKNLVTNPLAFGFASSPRDSMLKRMDFDEAMLSNGYGGMYRKDARWFREFCRAHGLLDEAAAPPVHDYELDRVSVRMEGLREFCH